MSLCVGVIDFSWVFKLCVNVIYFLLPYRLSSKDQQRAASECYPRMLIRHVLVMSWYQVWSPRQLDKLDPLLSSLPNWRIGWQYPSSYTLPPLRCGGSVQTDRKQPCESNLTGVAGDQQGLRVHVVGWLNFIFYCVFIVWMQYVRSCGFTSSSVTSREWDITPLVNCFTLCFESTVRVRKVLSMTVYC